MCQISCLFVIFQINRTQILELEEGKRLFVATFALLQDECVCEILVN